MTQNNQTGQNFLPYSNLEQTIKMHVMNGDDVLDSRSSKFNLKGHKSSAY